MDRAAGEGKDQDREGKGKGRVRALEREGESGEPPVGVKGKTGKGRNGERGGMRRKDDPSWIRGGGLERFECDTWVAGQTDVGIMCACVLLWLHVFLMKSVEKG